MAKLSPDSLIKDMRRIRKQIPGPSENTAFQFTYAIEEAEEMLGYMQDVYESLRKCDVTDRHINEAQQIIDSVHEMISAWEMELEYLRDK